MSLLARKERDAEVEALRQRVHPGTTVQTCADCGRRADCDDATLHERPGLDGQPQPWGMCSTCAGFGSRWRLARHVVALVLDEHPSPDVCGRVTVPRFIEQPLARTDRPNEIPWGHVVAADLARAVAEAHAAVRDAMVSTPCAWCGQTRRFKDRGEYEMHRSTGAMCPSCDWHLNRQWYLRDGRRDYVVARLLSSSFGHAPAGLGARVGLRFYSELTPEEQAALPDLRGPWKWVTRSWFLRSARAAGLTPDPERVFKLAW
jgi:hypothetical protein